MYSFIFTPDYNMFSFIAVLCSCACYGTDKECCRCPLRQVPVGEREMHLHTNEIGMWIKKVDQSSYERSSLGLNENNQIILPAKTNINFSSVQNVILIKFFHSKLNPFLCHESSRYINTHTVLFSLQDESKKEVPLISEEVTNLETFIKRKDRAAQRVKGIALIQNTSSLTDDDITLHKFVITQEYVSLQIVIHPKKKNEQFIVSIMHTYYEQKLIVPSRTINTWRIMK
ncbi:uncharacterized protein LOC143245934 [Tachypleus tridentatus]|uniref:uncharacterized protein LOC143245934 n=1 Tax=Tachypleus tridentatus TaxID=6853 RepID=UPI003FD5C1B5